MKIAELKKIVREENRLKTPFIFKNKAHKARANKVAIMFYEGNYRQRPPRQSVFRFSKLPRSNRDIRFFLSDTQEQSDFNF